ncbi:MAG: hypothetical protein KME42_02920 [Tildeniella nuda ZEHNDER 1965/U140]|nr:hypothetical protein [Tildeniella nuda ZEHNDER 1965/U140]
MYKHNILLFLRFSIPNTAANRIYQQGYDSLKLQPNLVEVPFRLTVGLS